ncbi:HAD-superfamily subfamily IIA hydrolase [Colletotrichum scovillei]|uniref:HAD-superfamily subfamily IIA hydrolase n=1 Tax=Colletotrichum scovillei TaxID=1209932 RepID=UPI0015C34540|nr:HAD-superfamily subfamily IIA hydrolase [Colletotrichum scovillei]KAF4778952.1 HAD-superfamily subfamily IIA hydrolase [Colletotrichum scovillei]
MAPNHRASSTGSFIESIQAARKQLDNMALGTPDSSLDGSEASSPGNSPVGSPASALSPVTPSISVDAPVADSFAFAFDIDGVLIRGGRAIPEAVEAMKVLNGENEYGIQIPYIFLTNGGGKTEEERCGDLSKQMEIEISPAQFICGHTPMREMADRFKTVLVVGGEGEKCRQVAEGYGFKDVITPGDIIKHNSATTPFRKLTPDELKNSREPGDIQIMLDIAMSKGGKIGTLSETFDEGPPIYFSHNDVVWSAAHDNVRLGMGALRRMLEVAFKDVTKKKGKLHTHAFGKPQVSTFEFATRLLQQWRRQQHGLDAPPDTVYFVGDTPESDIRGTNLYDEHADNEWHSILVKTGVYQDGTEPAYKPKATVNTVLDAVRYGIQREIRKRVVTSLRKDILGEEDCLRAMQEKGSACYTPLEERTQPILG